MTTRQTRASAYDRNGLHICADCGRDISHRRGHAVRCEPCAEGRLRERRNAASKRHQARVAATVGPRVLSKPPVPTAEQATPRAPTQPNMCKADCDDLAVTHIGFCNAHHERFKRGLEGEALCAPIKRHGLPRVACSVASCQHTVGAHTPDGLCRSHQRRKRLRQTMDTPLLVHRPLDPDRICETPTCAGRPSPTSHDRLCPKCRGRLKRGVSLADNPLLTRKGNPKTCEVDGCEGRHYSLHLCRFHYERVKRNVPLDAPLPKKAKGMLCELHTCSSPVKANGLCSSHYWRQRKGLDLDAPKGAFSAPPGTVRVNTDGYAAVKLPDGKWQLHHRYVMAQALGRPLLASEEVHHRDGEKANNDLANLELWDHSQPPGQRVTDKLAYAIEFCQRYGLSVTGQVPLLDLAPSMLGSER